MSKQELSNKEEIEITIKLAVKEETLNNAFRRVIPAMIRNMKEMKAEQDKQKILNTDNRGMEDMSWKDKKEEALNISHKLYQDLENFFSQFENEAENEAIIFELNGFGKITHENGIFRLPHNVSYLEMLTLEGVAEFIVTNGWEYPEYVELNVIDDGKK